MVSQERIIVELINKYGLLIDGCRIDKEGCELYGVPVEKVREMTYEGVI